VDEKERKYDFEKFQIESWLQTETMAINANLGIYQTAFVLVVGVIAFALGFWTATGLVKTWLGLVVVMLTLGATVLVFYKANVKITKRVEKTRSDLAERLKTLADSTATQKT
jgi:membrane protein implicated in regulation of membrane protease activity